MSLFEAMLVMLIAVPMVQQGVRLAEGYIRQQAGVQESRLLTQVVTAARTFALRDLNTLMTGRGDGNILVLTLEQLAAANAWVSTGRLRTAFGRNIQVILYDTGLNELIVLAHAYTLTGDDTPSYVPRGGEGIGLVGYIPANAPNTLLGPGLNYPLGPLRAQATTQGRRTPVVGDQLAIAILRMDQNVLPYLHRKAVQGQPELNQMQTDLDMDGNDLIEVGKVEAEQVISSNIIAEQADVTDQLEAKKIITESCTGCDQPPETEGRTTP